MENKKVDLSEKKIDLSEKKVITINIAQEGKPVHNVWVNKQEHEALQKWYNLREDLWWITKMGQIKLTEEEEKAVYAKHGVEWTPPAPPVTGRYIMTNLGMMWEDQGKVYKLSQAPDSVPYQPETEEYTGEYHITRGISSFDF